MSRRDRNRVQPRVADELEARRLLAAPQIPGNVGQVVLSQFQPFGFRSTVGTQLQDVKLRGAFAIDVVNPFPAADPPPPAPPINSGLIELSQFNGGGFRTVGLQFQRVVLGGGLTVGGFDNEAPGLASTGGTLPSDADASPAAATLPAFLNRGLIFNSQFSDGGFGVLERRPDGSILAREGRVGLQWRDTRVRGPVDVGLANLVLQPGATAVPSVASVVSDPGRTVVDFTTNIGRIRNSQFNDGGFGDIGMQWSKVAVGGHVGTLTNTLFLRPRQDNLGPITIEDLTFGGRPRAASPLARAGAAGADSAVRPTRVEARATGQGTPFRTTYTNSAANSGRLVGAQSNDGGFGDVGLQWRRTRVGGSVTAVHNSLTVQPENRGQGLITVRRVRFPTQPPAPSPPAPGPLRVLPPDPPAVALDGDLDGRVLPTPTGPLSPFFPIPFDGAGTGTVPFPGNFPLVNAASNSGLVRGGQFNAGGFGDQGLQWLNVRVGGDVRVVHNSLSVQPEGSQLAGIAVSDVAYGPPVPARVARHLKVLPYAVISPGSLPTVDEAVVRGGPVLAPPNDRVLTGQQLAAARGTDVFLQWNGIVHRRGLVLVHNVIKISGVGPETGPIILRNIRFPFRVPPVAPLEVASARPAVSASDPPRNAVLLNAANNSGVLRRAQFSDGGFGDDGFQWRNVRVGGSVAVAHNTLAVDATADLPAGDVPGPIAIANVTFNSGALNGGLSRRRNQVIVSPPDRFERVSSRPVDLGRPLPRNPAVRNEATNSGILAGGQLAAGGANHVLLQWQCVRVPGKVRVIDNILSISVLDRPAGPITISDVTFA